jgi:hypothetical protein
MQQGRIWQAGSCYSALAVGKSVTKHLQQSSAAQSAHHPAVHHIVCSLC